jgi:hypothetical protein
MKQTVTGGFMMRGGIDDPCPLTELERLQVNFNLAARLQSPKQDFVNKLIGEAVEIETWDEWIGFINTDPAHVLNTEADPWQVEAQAQAADAKDWQDQVTELRNG